MKTAMSAPKRAKKSRRADWNLPPRRQSTAYLCQEGHLRGPRAHLAEIQFALKERRLKLEADLAAIDRAEAVVRMNIQWAIRYRKRITHAKALRRLNREI